MTYGDENATFKPLPEMLRNARQAGLNLSTRERLPFLFIICYLLYYVCISILVLCLIFKSVDHLIFLDEVEFPSDHGFYIFHVRAKALYLSEQCLVFLI